MRHPTSPGAREPLTRFRKHSGSFVSWGTAAFTITFIATLAVASGVDRGMKWLSEVNMIVSGILLAVILLLGPTARICATYLSGMGLYARDFFAAGFFTAVTPEDVAWQGQWTVFFWAWWFSFAPFVGIFIAQISKGRTIRQVGLGVILLPTVAITIAMGILGGAGVYLDQASGVVGTRLDLASGFNRLVNRFSGGSDLAKGLSTAILLCCMGSMSILGPVQSALYGDNAYLFTNAILDGITSVVLASTFGIGMAWRCLPSQCPSSRPWECNTQPWEKPRSPK